MSEVARSCSSDATLCSIGQHPVLGIRRLTDVKHGASRRTRGGRAAALPGLFPDAYAGLERIKRLEQRLARARLKNRRQPELTRAIQIEAHAYRKTLDREQAAGTRESKPEFGLDPVSPTARQTTAAAPAKGARKNSHGHAITTHARQR